MPEQIALPYGSSRSDPLRIAFQLTATGNGIKKVALHRAGGHDPTPAGHVRKLIDTAREELSEYLSGRRSYFTVPMDLSDKSAFDCAALQLAASIPYGEVRTYKWIADRLGKPDAARAVGAAMAGNPLPLLIPCHRVVRTGGGLGGYLFGLEFKQALIDLEGRTPAFAGCGSTYIVCYRGCPHERRIQDSERILFTSLAEAEASGYRPCQVCRPV